MLAANNLKTTRFFIIGLMTAAAITTGAMSVRKGYGLPDYSTDHRDTTFSTSRRKSERISSKSSTTPGRSLTIRSIKRKKL
jgi:hypothetical protein